MTYMLNISFLKCTTVKTSWDVAIFFGEAVVEQQQVAARHSAKCKSLRWSNQFYSCNVEIPYRLDISDVT